MEASVHRTSLGLLAAASFTLAGVASGFAADLDIPYKSAPPPAPSWTGFYIGVNGGAGTGTTQTNANLGGALGGLGGLGGLGFMLPLTSQSFNGFLGGVQAGYNWQTGPFVLGVEGEFDGSTFQGTTSCVFLFSCTAKHDWVGDITARLGVVAFDKALIYVKGGAAWTDSNHSLSTNITGTVGGLGVTAGINASASDIAVGGLLGMGLEYGFLPHWSAKLEYDYIQFADQNVSTTLTATTGGLTLAVPLQIKESMQLMKAGINYHF
jgi:outer membrane immunogenic protein